MGAQTNMLTPHSVLQLALADVGLLSAGHGGVVWAERKRMSSLPKSSSPHRIYAKPQQFLKKVIFILFGSILVAACRVFHRGAQTPGCGTWRAQQLRRVG